MINNKNSNWKYSITSQYLHSIVFTVLLCFLFIDELSSSKLYICLLIFSHISATIMETKNRSNLGN